MPAPKRTPQSEAYKNVRAAADNHGEWNDCTVISIALATNTPYDRVHEILKRLGRKKGKGTSIANMMECCEELGYHMRSWTSGEYLEVIRTYPKAWHATVITTHQPRRCPKAWAPYRNRALIFHTARHVAAVINSEVQDWSINNSLRVNRIYEVTKKI
jgi:hypothetical protein